MKTSKSQTPNAVLKFSEHKLKAVAELESDLDALFGLPLAEFTSARNALAARLKKTGRGEEATRVKALAKPSVSAWAVNQLYWNHREAFERLIAAGERFHKAQTSRSAEKAADMREALEARRDAITDLSDLATALLRDLDQNPSLDTVRRITTTLEGMSAYAQRSDGPQPGRLTHDVDAPGFESLASFVPGMTSTPSRSKEVPHKQTQSPALLPTLSPPAAKKIADGANRPITKANRNDVSDDDDVRRIEEARKAKLAEAKLSLQAAKRSLTTARARTQSLAAAQKKADAEARQAEKRRRDAELSLEKARVAAEAATRRARDIAVELEESTRTVNDAERAVEATAKELESLLRES
jgi:hypothetical protein